MSKVVSLVTPRRGEPDKDLIKTIEELLNEAKNGELCGIAFAAIYPNQVFRTNWDGTASALETNGAVAMLAHDFAKAINNLPEEKEIS